jgi:hypothetical protein
MELLKIYPQGEGLITYYLLESLYNDLKLKKYPLATDRPLPLKGETLIAVVEEAQEFLTTLGNVKVFAKNCKGLSNCSEFKTDLWLKALKEILKMLGENNIFTAIEKWEQEVKKGLGLENGETLKELINFYIPVLVGKRKSYLFAWKYNLTRRGTPSVTFKYPQEGKGFLNFLSNPVFSDKLVPLFLGFLEKELTEKVKNLGFVPYTVMGKGRTPLETELNLIELSFKV